MTGIADIMRGASVASETATAQQLKAQFGSMRVRDLQTEVQRFVRDIMRLRPRSCASARAADPDADDGHRTGACADAGAAKQMAQANPQQAQQSRRRTRRSPKAIMEQPALEEVFGILRSDQMRAYRIDVETDSTIRGDMMRAQSR